MSIACGNYHRGGFRRGKMRFAVRKAESRWFSQVMDIVAARSIGQAFLDVHCL
jgi:hypothetical protein